MFCICMLHTWGCCTWCAFSFKSSFLLHLGVEMPTCYLQAMVMFVNLGDSQKHKVPISHWLCICINSNLLRVNCHTTILWRPMMLFEQRSLLCGYWSGVGNTRLMTRGGQSESMELPEALWERCKSWTCQPKWKISVVACPLLPPASNSLCTSHTMHHMQSNEHKYTFSSTSGMDNSAWTPWLFGSVHTVAACCGP